MNSYLSCLRVLDLEDRLPDLIGSVINITQHCLSACYKKSVSFQNEPRVPEGFDHSPSYVYQDEVAGVSFSVPDNVKIPPSLVNIYKEIENEYKTQFVNKGGDLTYLAKQGVLLLNTILTVREASPQSHNIKEYNLFMQDIISTLNKLDQPIVFLLWGGNAKGLAKYLTNKNHLILTATHPSPLGANHGGWFNCNHFRLTNDFLVKNGLKPINWLK